MNDRREPTISGLRADPEEPRRPAKAGSSARQQPQGARPRAAARPAPAAPQRPVIVRSKLAPFALLVALVSAGGAGYLAKLSLDLQAALTDSQARLMVLEEKLVMSDDESSASAATMQVSLKEAHSEIRKLWGVSYDTNRKTIAENKAQIIVSKKQAADAKKSANSLVGEMAKLSDLVDAQAGTVKRVEQSLASVSAQARSINERNARVEQRLAEIKEQLGDIDQDIEAINGFRRTVNQQLLELKGGTP